MVGIPFAVGQVFRGSTMLPGDAGQIAFVKTASVTFTTGTPSFINNFLITSDVLGSAQTFPTPPIGTITLQNVTITSVNFNGNFTLTKPELPAGTIPADFPLPYSAKGVVLGLNVVTDRGTFPATAGECAEIGALALMGAIHIIAFGQTLDAGGGILSIGAQTTGTVNEVFGPTFAAACFAAGTRILTEAGAVRIERLRVGDTVVLASGGSAPVIWLGHRTVDCRRHPQPENVWPVRVRADAFGPGRPDRDLLLSPDHAVFMAGMGTAGALVPIRYLINGATIMQERQDTITYWHVELPAHGLVLAEGLVSESYLDTGNRAAFANGGTSVMAQPDFAMRVWESESCAPLVTGGLDLEAQQHALLARASEMGHARTDDAAPVLIVNGIELRPARYGARLVFKLPVGAVRGVLASRTYVPAQLEPGSTDRRRLGVAVVAMVLDRQPIDLAGPMQGTGWHAPEAKLRWTDGAATIDLAGCARLTLTLATWGQYWCDPTPRSTVDTHAA